MYSRQRSATSRGVHADFCKQLRKNASRPRVMLSSASADPPKCRGNSRRMRSDIPSCGKWGSNSWECLARRCAPRMLTAWLAQPVWSPGRRCIRWYYPRSPYSRILAQKNKHVFLKLPPINRGGAGSSPSKAARMPRRALYPIGSSLQSLAY